MGHSGEEQRPGPLVEPVPGRLSCPASRHELKDRPGTQMEPGTEKQGWCCLLPVALLGCSLTDTYEEMGGRGTSSEPRWRRGGQLLGTSSPQPQPQPGRPDPGGPRGRYGLGDTPSLKTCTQSTSCHLSNIPQNSLQLTLPPAPYHLDSTQQLGQFLFVFLVLLCS